MKVGGQEGTPIVACGGPAGSFAHLTAQRIFGPIDESGYQYRLLADSDSVLKTLEDGMALWGIVTASREGSDDLRAQHGCHTLAAIDVDASYALLWSEVDSSTVSPLSRVACDSDAAKAFSAMNSTLSLARLLQGTLIIHVSSPLEALRLAERERHSTAAMVPAGLAALTPLRNLFDGVYRGDLERSRKHILLVSDFLTAVGTCPLSCTLEHCDRPLGLVAAKEFVRGILQTVQGRERTGPEESPSLLGRLPRPVADQLSVTGYCRLYEHAAVRSMDDVWAILGVPPTRMLKTLVLGDRSSDRIALCCVRGDRRVDKAAVSKLLGGSWANVALCMLPDRGLVPGAISPFTAPSGAAICLDDDLPSEGWLYLGSGDPCLSIALDTARVRWPQTWKVARLSQRG